MVLWCSDFFQACIFSDFCLWDFASISFSRYDFYAKAGVENAFIGGNVII